MSCFGSEETENGFVSDLSETAGGWWWGGDVTDKQDE